MFKTALVRFILIALGILTGIGGTLYCVHLYEIYSFNVSTRLIRMANAPKGIADWEVQPNFKLETFASGFDLPTRIVFPPAESSQAADVVCYVAELSGRIKAIKHDREVVPICEGLLNFQRKDKLGLVGLDFHPNESELFATMTYWDEDGGVFRNKVDRLQLETDGLRVLDRTTILDIDEPTVASYQIMFVRFAPDGNLLVGVGSGGQKIDAINLDKFAGKIIRMQPNGKSLPDNPFYDAKAPDAARSYVYAFGLRNPYDIIWYPGTDEAFVGDVGPNIDRILHLQKGVNYCFEGSINGDDTMRSNAIYTFGPEGNYAPTGLSMIDNQHYGFGDGLGLLVGIFGPVFASGSGDGKCIYRFDVTPNGNISGSISEVVRYSGKFFSAVTDVEVGHDKTIYFADYYGGVDAPFDGKGIVYRLSPQDNFKTMEALGASGFRGN